MEGAKEKKPVLILPGFMSTGLVVKRSDDRPRWKDKRLWLSLSKLGFTGKMLGRTVDMETNDERVANVTLRNDWLSHMMLRSDLLTESEGIEVRPLGGLAGVDFLDPGAFTGLASWVFGPVISILFKNGYTEGFDLDAAGYDWRIPPGMLEQRDQYFTKTLDRIQRMRTETGKPVALLCHSMGCNAGHYLLNFAKTTRGESWLENCVDSLVLVGAPHRGSPSALRGLIVGSNMGLPTAFLSTRNALIFGRHLGSTPWLLPTTSDGEIDRTSPLPFGAAMIKREGKLIVSLRFADIQNMTGILRNLGQLRVAVKFGKHKYYSAWFSPRQPNPVKIEGEDENGFLTVEFPTPHQLNSENDGLKIKILEQRLATKRAVRRLLNVDSISESFYPAVMSGAARALYDNTLGYADGISSGKSICSAVVSLSRTLPENYTSGELLSLNVDLRHSSKSTRQGARAVVNVHFSFESDEALHFKSGVSIPQPLNCSMLRPKSSLHVPFVQSVKKEPSVPCAIYSPENAIKMERITASVELWDSIFYQKDPLLCPTRPPPIPKVLAIYGVDVKTEVHCILRRASLASSTYVTNALELDGSVELEGDFLVENCYESSNGQIFETPQSPQLSKRTGLKVCRSGDGVVPYESLQHVFTWADECELQVHELKGVQHREILQNKQFHKILLDFLVPTGTHSLQHLKTDRECTSFFSSPSKIAITPSAPPEPTSLQPPISPIVTASTVKHSPIKPDGGRKGVASTSKPPDPPIRTTSLQSGRQAGITTSPSHHPHLFHPSSPRPPPLPPKPKSHANATMGNVQMARTEVLTIDELARDLQFLPVATVIAHDIVNSQKYQAGDMNATHL